MGHMIGDKVEAAYMRGDMFGKRRKLMQDWAKSRRARLFTAGAGPVEARISG